MRALGGPGVPGEANWVLFRAARPPNYVTIRK